MAPPLLQPLLQRQPPRRFQLPGSAERRNASTARTRLFAVSLGVSPSLVKTLVTWVSTVRALRKSSCYPEVGPSLRHVPSTSSSRSLSVSGMLGFRFLHQPPHDGGVDNGFAPGHPRQALHERVGVGDVIFQQVPTPELTVSSNWLAYLVSA